MDSIILNEISVSGKNVIYKFTATGGVQKFFKYDELWIEYDEDMSQVSPSILSIPFVSIMLPIMWVTNSIVWVNEIDRTFYEATFALRRAYQDMYPNCPLRGKLIPSYIKKNEVALSEQAFILFSGGADAHTSYIRHKDEISRLVNIQGFLESQDTYNKAAEADFKDIASFAKQQKKETSFVKSNFALLINQKPFAPYTKLLGDQLWHGLQHSMAFISFAIPLAYKHNCSRLYIASSNTVGVNISCASSPTTDTAFSYAQNGEVIHDGFELDRQDKIGVIASYQKNLGEAYPIRVCSFNDHNCCECEKCFRTILALVAECADIKDFGFCIDKPLVEHWNEVIYRKGGLMGFYVERRIYWSHIIKRMKENYALMNQEQKDFVDWFLTFDFDKAQRASRMRYYRANFFSILKRKLSSK